MQEIKKGHEYRTAVMESIARVGFGVTGVTADGAVNELPYAYTSGLTLKGMPELIITGDLPVELLGDMLIFVIASSIDNGEFVEGLVDCGHETNGNVLRAYLTPVKDRDLAVNRYAHLTQELYGEAAEYWQLTWADGNNILPTEEGYDVELRQPLI